VTPSGELKTLEVALYFVIVGLAPAHASLIFDDSTDLYIANFLPFNHVPL
jgi:hypothetical protein